MLRILSIDGGGIRGIIPGEILVQFENYLQLYSGREDAKIADYFDLICGTSTGALLASLYLKCDEEQGDRPKYTAKDVVNLYYEHGSKIFYRSFLHRLRTLDGRIGTKYGTKEMEKLLTYYFQDTRLSELLKPCLIPCYDMERSKAVFFNHTDPIQSGKEDFPIQWILRGAIAVPSFFPPQEITGKNGEKMSLIDGGVFANNPALCGVVEAGKIDEGLNIRNLSILSIGTGAHELSYPHSLIKDWGQFQWIRPMVEIIAEGASETVDFQLDKLFHSVKRREQYLRIQPDLSKYVHAKLRFDDVSEKNMTTLKAIGEESGRRYERELRAFARKIVNGA